MVRKVRRLQDLDQSIRIKEVKSVKGFVDLISESELFSFPISITWGNGKIILRKATGFNTGNVAIPFPLIKRQTAGRAGNQYRVRIPKKQFIEPGIYLFDVYESEPEMKVIYFEDMIS